MADAEKTPYSFSVLFKELGDHIDGRSAYEDDLDDALQRLGIGEVDGGGTSLDGSGCDIGVTVTNREAGLATIREVLRSLAAPFSTRIVGDDGEFSLYDSEEQYRECLRVELERQGDIESR